MLSFALLALLALVALASRGEQPLLGRDGAAREPSTTFFDYLFSVSLAVAVVGFALALWALLTGKGGERQEQRKNVKLLGTVFICAIFIGIALGVRFADLNLERAGNGGSIRNPNTSTESVEPRSPAPSRAPEFRWLPAILVFGAALAGAAVLIAATRRRRQPGLPTTDRRFVDELAALLDDTLDDLRAEPDPRRAVIAAYARTERALAAYAFARRPFEAPLEYLDRIAAPLHERLPSARRLVFELTHLYERAKFSSHAVDAEMKDDAIRTLATLRDELRGAEAA